MRPSRLRALAFPLALLAAAVVLPACPTKETAPEVKPAKAGRVEVKKHGTILGFVHITPGAPGRLELTDNSNDAKELEELWTKSNGSASVAVDTEKMRGDVREHNTTVVPSTSPDYGEYVRYFLISKGYEAQMREPASTAPKAATTTPTTPEAASASAQAPGPAPTIPELAPLEKELRGGIPAGSGDYAKVLALATLHKRGTISFKQLEEAIVAMRLPPHKVNDAYLMTPSPAPPPGVKWDEKMMPSDWEGNWGEVAMAYHLGVLTKEQYKELHKAAHPTGCKL